MSSMLLPGVDSLSFRRVRSKGAWYAALIDGYVAGSGIGGRRRSACGIDMVILISVLFSGSGVVCLELKQLVQDGGCRNAGHELEPDV